MVGPDARGPRPGFRGDVDGLRAVAILLVIAYHGLVPGFGGGFVGVDVFFVISGYLITTNLLKQFDSGEPIRLRSFWARRMRRLAPALTLLNVCVLLAAVVVVSPLFWSGVVKEVLAASLYVSNLFYAREAQDYFTADLSRSVGLHTWSLGVEEQFYLLWPLLMLAAGWIAARRAAWSRRSVLVTTLAVVTVVSFAISVITTMRGRPTSFYGLGSRAWEFGLAGLLACAGRWLSAHRSPLAAGIAGWVGTALLAVGLIFIGHGASFPGFAALIPVGATLLLITAGTIGWSPVSTLLAARPMQAIGRVSYSWYLWHWPAIVFATVVLDDSVGVRTAASIASLLPAIAAYRYVEQPLRRSVRWARPRTTYAVVASVTVVMIAASSGVYLLGRSAIAADPLLARLDAAQESPLGDTDCRPPRPSIDVPSTDVCELGEPGASRTMILVGDSHAQHWMSGLDEAGRLLDVRVLVRWSHDCPFTDTHTTLAFNPRVPDRWCRSRVKSTRSIINDVRPDLVVISNWAGYLGRISNHDDRVPASEPAQLALWRGGLTAIASSLRSEGIGVVVMEDSPTFAVDPIRCLAETESVASCTLSRSASLSGVAALRDASRVAAADAGVPTIDAMDLTCLETACPPIIDDQVVYRDSNHITAEFAASRAEPLAEQLAEAFPTGQRPE